MKSFALANKKLHDLTPDTRNANKGTERGTAMIESSLRTYGAGRSILIDKHGRIIAGNKTAENAGSIGIDDVLVVQTDGTKLVAVQRMDLDLEKDKAAQELAIADNRAGQVSLDWDIDVLKELDVDLAKFWSEDELSVLLAEKEHAELLTDEDDVPEVPAEPETKPGDLYVMGNHRLLCGDSTSITDVERLMDRQLADLCFTSPPYGVGLDYGKYEDTFENCRKLLNDVAPAIWSVLRDGGFCITNFGDIISGRAINGTEHPSEYPMALEYWPAFTNAGFGLHSRRIWAKPHARVASPWCASSNRAASDWEHLWTWLKPGKFLNERREPSYLGVWDTSRLEGVTIGKDTHPAAFPVGVAVLIIEVYSNAQDILFEPFGGTGTAMIAAEKTNRKARLMELDPKYCDVIVKRWEAATGKKAERIHGETPQGS